MGLQNFSFRDPLASPAGGGQTEVFQAERIKPIGNMGLIGIDMTSAKDPKAL